MTAQQRALAWMAGFGLSLAMLYLLRGVLLPFVAGMAVAYFLDPACDWLEEKGCSRTVATGIITAVFFILAGALLILIAPLATGQVVDFFDKAPGYFTVLREKAGPLIERLSPYIGDGGVTDLRETIGTHTGEAVRWAAGLLGGLVLQLSALASLLSLIVITPIVSFYLLRDWDHIVAKVDGWLPRAHAETIREQLRLIDNSLAGFVRGQVTVCVILGSFYGIALTIAGLDFGFIVGFTTGLVSFVPYFGLLLGFIVGLALALAQFDTWTSVAIIAAIFAVGQVVESNFITPKLVGERVGLHAAWIIFALLAGGTLFGFLGIMLAVPVAAVIGVLIRFGVAEYLKSPLYLTGAPPPAKPEKTRKTGKKKS